MPATMEVRERVQIALAIVIVQIPPTSNTLVVVVVLGENDEVVRIGEIGDG